MVTLTPDTGVLATNTSDSADGVALTGTVTAIPILSPEPCSAWLILCGLLRITLLARLRMLNLREVPRNLGTKVADEKSLFAPRILIIFRQVNFRFTCGPSTKDRTKESSGRIS
jgi:hypothetical protein